MMNGLNRIIGIKLMLTLSLLGGVLVVAASTGQPERTKKQNMVDMANEFNALNSKMMAGALTAKFTDEDFQQISSHCAKLIDLAHEYAQLESDQEISAISASMATSVDYLKQQAARKDPLVLVMTYGRLLSFCAECHYKTRWAAQPPSPPSSRQQ